VRGTRSASRRRARGNPPENLWIPHRRGGEDCRVKSYSRRDSQEVVNVAGAVRNGRQRANILNSDGQPHPVENFMAVLTLLLGLISFILGMIIRNAHTGAAVIVTATATGLVACLVGLYVQMISATREQRVLIVAGIIAGFVGLALGLSKGGFSA
jgi:uncharacterized membrane protein